MRIYPLALLAACMALPAFSKEPAPIKALLVTGGCCHDYAFQSGQLTHETEQRIRIEWTVDFEVKGGTKAQYARYADPAWAQPFDVVVHNECFANTEDPDYIRRITAAHAAGVPAVVIHCAMHTYRKATIDDWREFLGVTSKHHEHQSQYPVQVAEPNHPIMKNFPKDWVTPKDELYVVTKVWPNTTPLAHSKSERNEKTHPVFWTSTYGKARVFGTTFGHTNAMFEDPVFLDTVTKGLLWSTGHLQDNGQPAAGYGVTK